MHSVTLLYTINYSHDVVMSMSIQTFDHQHPGSCVVCLSTDTVPADRVGIHPAGPLHLLLLYSEVLVLHLLYLAEMSGLLCSRCNFSVACRC